MDATCEALRLLEISAIAALTALLTIFVAWVKKYLKP
jgi:hypothetical protein